MPLGVALRYLAAADCTNVEVPAMPGYLPRWKSIRGQLERQGLNPTAVSLGVPFSLGEPRLDLLSSRESVRKESVEYVHKSIEFASHLGAGVIYACSLNPCPPESRSKAMALLKQDLADFADHAKATDLRFGLEPFPTGELATVRETNDVIRETGSNNLGIVLDTGHAAISGEALGESVRISKGNIIHVHLNNNDGVGDIHWPPQVGKLTPDDFRDFLVELRNQDYRGNLSIELAKPRPIVDTMIRSRQFLEKL
jgi:sugar phosphate isomerase/epimerase